MGYQVDLLHSLISESWKERLGHMKGISEVIHGHSQLWLNSWIVEIKDGLGQCVK